MPGKHFLLGPVHRIAVLLAHPVRPAPSLLLRAKSSKFAGHFGHFLACLPHPLQRADQCGLYGLPTAIGRNPGAAKRCNLSEWGIPAAAIGIQGILRGFGQAGKEIL